MRQPNQRLIGIGAALLRTPPTPPSMRLRTRRFDVGKHPVSSIHRFSN